MVLMIPSRVIDVSIKPGAMQTYFTPTAWSGVCGDTANWWTSRSAFTHPV